MKKRVKCLYRVSTKKQVEKEDIPMQRQSCRAFSETHPDWEIVEEKVELGISGFKVSARQRDAVLELQEEALNGEFDILLVFMMDRLGRISEETPFIATWFDSHGIEVWSATEGQQHYETQVDKLLNYIRFWQAEGESIKTSIRTKTRLGQIVQLGYFRGGVAPYGYRLEKRGRLNVRGNEVNDIFIDESEAIVIRRIFELSAVYGYGSRKIASTLTEEGLYNRSGKPFHPSTIQNYLKNVLYTGVLRSGDSYSEVFEHLQIIPVELFDLAQKQIESHNMAYQESRLSPVRHEGQTLLTGIIFCGSCGGRLNATSVRKAHHKKNGENPRVAVYRCYNRARHKELCDGQSTYRADRVDPEVEKAVKEVLSCIRLTDSDTYRKKRRQSEVAALRSQMKRLEKEFADASEKRRKLGAYMVDALEGTGPFTAEDLKEQMDALKEECERISAQMEAQKTLLEQSDRREKAIAQQFDLLKGYAEIYENASFEDKRRIVAALVEKVTVSRGNAPGEYDIQIFFRIGLDWLEEMKNAG